MRDTKILLTYKDDEGNYQIESVWATKEGDYYRINNIPFLASNIALNDLVKAEEDSGALYFEELIKASGHSVVQIIILIDETKDMLTSELETRRCTWEGSHLNSLISVDVPSDVDYFSLKKYLDNGEQNGFWTYKEACLAH